MKIVLDPRKTAHQNAAHYYEEAKKFKSKAEGAKKAAEHTKRKLAELEKRGASAARPASEKREKKDAKRKWFHDFRWFFTSGGFLVVAGKDAKQNDLLGAKHLTPEDFFFHAEIVGAPATILKTAGRTPSEQDEREAAQWAAVYSRAWREGLHAVDVYCVPGSQISKYSHGEFVGKGAFMVLGKRKYFKNAELKLKIGFAKSGVVTAVPHCFPQALEKEVVLAPGDVPKESFARQLSKRLGAKLDDLMQVVPGDSTFS